MKKKRTKKYRPKEVRTPMLVRAYLHGDEMSERELEVLDEFVNSSIDKLQLLSIDKQAYNIMESVCRHFYVLSVAFDESEERQRLAQYARIAVRALWTDLAVRQNSRTLQDNDNLRRAFVEVFAVVAAEFKALCQVSSFKELMNSGDCMSKVPDTEYDDCWVVDPSTEVVDDPALYGQPGTCFINGKIQHGTLVMINGVPAWHVDNGPKLRLMSPVFIALDPKTGE